MGFVTNREFPDGLRSISYLRRSLVMELNSKLKCMEFQGQKDRYRTAFILHLAQVKHVKWAGSSVGIATELRAGRSGIESRWGRDFLPVQTGPGAHPAYCKIGTGSFPRVNCGRGLLLTTHPLLVPRSWKSRVIPLPTLWATPGL